MQHNLSDNVTRFMRLVLLLCLLLTDGCYCQGSYYTASRGNGLGSRHRGVGSDIGVLETLRRGHEGLLFKLDHLNKAIKEDELKLNNVFYKLGRHDTDIEASTDLQASLKQDTRRLEAKLNKQAYNVDFLRRHVSDLKRGVSRSSANEVTVSALQSTVNTLQMSLAQALLRTEQLENKTKILEQELAHPVVHGSIDENNIYYASRTPKTTYYYLDADSIEGVCDESSGWQSTPAGGCWWVSTEEVAYLGALKGCASIGGILAQMPTSDSSWQEHFTKMIQGDLKQHSYWTSGTSVFSPGTWVYIFSGDPVNDRHWSNDATSSDKYCAAIGASGLSKFSCHDRHRYLCEKI